MKEIYSTSFRSSFDFTPSLKLIEQVGGRQTFVFFTTVASNELGLGMLEVLINEDLGDDSQLVIEEEELDFPSDDRSNYGPLNIGGGHQYLITFYDRFTWAKVYTVCGYN